MSENVVYARKLYKQELGYRNNIPAKAGRYFFVSKDCIDFFPLLSDVVKNDRVLLNIIPPGSDTVVLSKYVYHNDKRLGLGTRDEFRLYLNSQVDQDRSFFKLDDIVLIQREIVDREVYYHLHHFPAATKTADYLALEKLINESEIPGGNHALLPVSGLSFLHLTNRAIVGEKLVPKEIVDEVLAEPPLPLSEPVMNREFEFTNIIRESAFRDLLLFFYDYKCAITGKAIKYKSYINLEGAHIIPDQYRGPAHPKNGIPILRDLHWAFDLGFFTIDTDYKILVHEKAMGNPMLSEVNGKALSLPHDQRAWPSQESLRWHKDRVFGLFTRAI